jgi:glycosyltransferase involved in cell wall biosynthesis
VDIATSLPHDAATWLIYGIDPTNRAPYVERCKERLSSAGLIDRVQWMGTVSNPGEAYRQMDILLVPSLKESWCRVTMEGMAAGLPVVGTAIPGMSEIFRLVPSPLTFPVDRPDVAAQHLLRLAGDPALREAIGSQGRSAMRAFDARMVCNQLEHLYEDLLGATESQ